MEGLLLLGWLTGVCQFGFILTSPSISIDTPSKEHEDHFLIQKQIKQEISSEDCQFDNYTWDRVIAERKQELRWEKRVEDYKKGLITTGLYVDEKDKNTHWTDRYSWKKELTDSLITELDEVNEDYKKGFITTGLYVNKKDKNTHWTDRYSGFWFPHNFRRRRAVNLAVDTLADQYRELEVLRNVENAQRKRRAVRNGVMADGDRMRPFEDGAPRGVVKSNHFIRSKRSLADPSGNLPPLRRHLVRRLQRTLLARQKRHLSERERPHLDQYAFQAKDYNYYDYNNMLTAITRFSPTIKFVEYNKKHKVDIAQAANVENFNRKLKNVFGGFHNDSEMLTFLKNYPLTNYTHEERKFAFWDDFMLNRARAEEAVFFKNLENYKKHYRSFREKSNRENHTYVDPDKEDQSAIIPHFHGFEVYNYTELYRHFRIACDFKEEQEKSSEIEPEPVNYYMPENHTDSPESAPCRSGELEAFISDYENNRINLSQITKSRKRKRAVGPKIFGHIDIKLYDDFGGNEARPGGKHRTYARPSGQFAKFGANKESLDQPRDGNTDLASKRRNGKNENPRNLFGDNNVIRRSENDGKHLANTDLEGKNNEGTLEYVQRGKDSRDDSVDIVENVKIDEGCRKAGKSNGMKRIDIKFEIEEKFPNRERSQNDGDQKDDTDQNGLVRTDIHTNRKFNVLSEILDLMNAKVNVNIINYILNKFQDAQADADQERGVFSVIDKILENVVGGMTPRKFFKVFEIFDTNLEGPKRVNRVKRSLSETKYLAIDKVIKTIDNKDDYVLHLYLVPTDESQALLPRGYRRSKRNVAYNKEKIGLEEEEDPNDCPLMKRVFYWKKVRELNKDVVMSHEASIDAISMDNYMKRRERRMKGITTKEELLEKQKFEKLNKEMEEEDLRAQEILEREAVTEKEITEDPDLCPLMKRIYYWKSIRGQNNVTMSCEAAIDAITMDDWHKRRERHMKGITLPGEERRMNYEEALKNETQQRVDPSKGEELKRKKRDEPQQRVDPSKGEELRRKKRDNEGRDASHGDSERPVNACPFNFESPGKEESPKEQEEVGERNQGCAFTFEPPAPKEEPNPGCAFTFEPPAPKEEPNPGCAFTFEPPAPKEEPNSGCAFTFEPPVPKEEPNPGCAFTFEPPVPKEEPEEPPVNACPFNFESPAKEEFFKEEAPIEPPQDQQEPQDAAKFHSPKSAWVRKTPLWSTILVRKEPFAGTSQNRMSFFSRNGSLPFSPQPGFRPAYSPFIVNNWYSRRRVGYATRTVNPVSKVVEPKFVRVIYHGPDYVWHVHYTSKEERARRKKTAGPNPYYEGFQLSTNETLKKLLRARVLLPRVIQNHYASWGNFTRFLNMFYDPDGDIIYKSLDGRRRLAIPGKEGQNKYNYRSYFSRGSKKTLLDAQEPVLVQLHYGS
ncbi:hypothetical protein M8J77_020806 [Diaphorina citri]|nr:hypothetical protein M8J77_020806 [Diaphorina citri]